MSIASEIARLQSDSTAIANAIAAKGVTVPAGSGYDDYASLIATIPTGGLPAWLKDGDTHLWIDIINSYQLTQKLRIKMMGTINWGDGTIESISATSNTTFSHTYSSAGKYRIDLHPTSGTFTLGNGGSSYNVMGSTNNRDSTAALYQAEIGSSIIITITAYAFYYCRGLQRVYIPDNITTIGTHVFCGCYSLKELEIKDASKLTSVGGTNQFYLCYNLQDIGSLVCNANNTLTYTYRECHTLHACTIPANVTTIGAYCFYNDYTMLDIYVLPTTPPKVSNANAFTSLNANCVIHVPNGKLATYQAASIWSDLASQMVETPAS